MRGATRSLAVVRMLVQRLRAALLMAAVLAAWPPAPAQAPAGPPSPLASLLPPSLVASLSVTPLLAAPAQAQAAPVFRSEARMVEVYATVLDHKGRPVAGLTRDSFLVTDNGVPQPIVSFESKDSELYCALLLDATGSMSQALPTLKRAVFGLIDDLRPNDLLAVYAFHTSTTLLLDFTRDRESAKQAVLQLRTGGRTALFDAVVQVGLELGRRRGRKALIVLTDGDDNASFLGSDAATTRVRKVGVPLYAVAQGDALLSPKLVQQLKQLAAETGGLAFEARKPDDIGEVFAAIYKDLSQAYLLGYPAPLAENTRWRSIRVSVKGTDDLRIRAKQGYMP